MSSAEPPLLHELRDWASSLQMADEGIGLMRELYPICRSITGSGVRQTLDRVAALVPLERTQVPSGARLFDWEVPPEWNIRDAYIKDARGERVVDFRAHSLHVVGYSRPLHERFTLEQLQPHLHSLPERPDWIPYRTSYYRTDWGFCLSHRAREQLAPGTYEVRIDADLAPGHLIYAEACIEGRSEQQGLVYTHICHPSLVNDNLTGIAAAALIARQLRQARPRLTWRVVFAPGTIGSLAWLSRNEAMLPRLRGGLVIALLGDRGAVTYKRSRRGDTATDRAVSQVLRRAGVQAREMDFEPYGYDERQFCSPGFNLPIGRLTRSVNGGYPEYHTSADDLAVIDRDCFAESLRVLGESVAAIDANRAVVNLNPQGEPRLGKRGLYSDMGGVPPQRFQQALLWVLNLSDGEHDLVSIAERSGLDLDLVVRAAEALQVAQLVRGVS